MGRIKEVSKEKQVKYSDIEKIFNRIDTYLEKIKDSAKNTETEAEKLAYEHEFENLKNEIKKVGNYQSEIKISKFEDTALIENLSKLKIKTISKIKTKQPKKTYKLIKKTTL